MNNLPFQKILLFKMYLITLKCLTNRWTIDLTK